MVTVSGITIDARPEQLAKARSLILMTELGITTAKTSTLSKSPIMNTSDRVRNHYGCEAGASSESLTGNMCDGVGKNY